VRGRIEYVFEECGDAELLVAMGEAQQAERAAFARQLLAVGEFTHRRMEAVYAEHDFWCVDDWEAIAAEIGAELGISRGTYTTQPLGAQFFPQLGLPTETLILPNSPPPSPHRDLAMPKRRRTRTQDRAYRVQYERAQNRARYEADPPPF
jgi:hypothetical protein